MQIDATGNTILLDQQPYPKGSLRPHYDGNVVSVIFPYFSNLPAKVPDGALFSANFDQYILNGVQCASIQDFKDFEDANFYV